MENTHTVKTIANSTKSREMDMCDILGSMEELANMIGIRSSGYNCEILAIERPGVSALSSGNLSEDSIKSHLRPGKSQVLYFKKK